MRFEMERSRQLTVRQHDLLLEEHERRYDVHVSATDWDVSHARLTLVNAGPCPAVQVSVRVYSRTREQERFVVGTSSSIAVGGTIEIPLSQELHPDMDFPGVGEDGLTIEIVARTALGRDMPIKVERPTFKDQD